jgi:putative transcriptional regulator
MSTKPKTQSPGPIYNEIVGMVEGRVAPGSITTFEEGPDGKVRAIRHTGEEARKIMERKHQEKLADHRAYFSDTRQKLDMTQAQFARFLGVSVRTLQQWEQRRREPSASARMLIEIAKRHPQAVKQTTQELALV